MGGCCIGFSVCGLVDGQGLDNWGEGHTNLVARIAVVADIQGVSGLAWAWA